MKKSCVNCVTPRTDPCSCRDIKLNCRIGKTYPIKTWVCKGCRKPCILHVYDCDSVPSGLCAINRDKLSKWEVL